MVTGILGSSQRQSPLHIQVMTGGQSGTQVIAFQMLQQVNFGNVGTASTYATLLFLAILPVMIYNMRNMQKAR